jgi:outer membrane lipoprotein SlyB
MRKLVLAATLAMSLGGCATNATVTGDINATIQAVIDATKLACHFQPTIATVASLLTAGTGTAIVQTVDTIAAAICQAVQPAVVSSRLRAKLRGASPTPIVVNGVVIHGRFVP